MRLVGGLLALVVGVFDVLARRRDQFGKIDSVDAWQVATRHGMHQQGRY